MRAFLKITGMALNASVLALFVFFILAMIEDGKAGSMAEAVTNGNGVELLELPPKLVSEDSEAICMALNIYYESRSDNLAGQYAVADVVLNRVQDSRYPNTICEVVKQGPVRESWKTKQDPDLSESERIYNPIRHKCQFSWYCDGKSDDPKSETGWAQAQYVAGAIMYSGKFRGMTEGATHYHATYVKPKWRFDRGMNHIGRIGAHIFYKWD